MARKENWVTRRLSAKSKDYAKRNLARLNGFLRYFTLIDPSLGSKLFPMSPGQNGYVVHAHVELSFDGSQPIPPRELRLGEGGSEEWIASGVSDVEQMSRLIFDSGQSLAETGRVLDYGCSAGRMVRHLKGVLDSVEVWGVDIASEHIYWNQLHLDQRFNFATVTSHPSLPFEDNYFGLVYAGSVFTHIDDLFDATLLELRRVTRIGGLLYLTFLDDDTIKLYQRHSEVPFYHFVLRTKYYREYESRKAVKFVIGRSLNSYVYFRSEFLRAKLSKWFDLLEVRPQGYGLTQTVYLLRKYS